MKIKFLLIAVLLLVFSANLSAENIYSLIKNGNLKEASDSLSSLSTASRRDGNNLFYLSLIEKDAVNSAQLMEASLNAGVSPVYKQEIYYRLAQFYFVRNNFELMSKYVTEYRIQWENGKYRRQMVRFAVILNERSKQYETAIKNIDRYLLEYNRGDDRQWGMVDKARIMKKYDKSVATYRLLRTLSRDSKGPGIPQALYMLTFDAIEKRKTDDAVFFYNLMREGYPSAIGLDATIDKLGLLSTSADTDDTAEKLTGIYYSVKVGVFSIKENAKRLAGEFRKYDKKVDIKKKNISGNTYHVVYVGHFTTYDTAYRFKQQLEQNHKEVYQVIAR
jgi:hypothetical protein